MSSASHWRKALPYYVKASFRFSLIFWTLPLAIVLAGMIWIAVTTRQLVVSRAGLGLTITFGGGFFLLALFTSLAADLYRNREVQEGTIEWNPVLVWKAFIYLGAFFFLAAAFLAYHQGVWLSVGFICLFISSAIVARVCFRKGF
jgi:hypothetical protein